MYSKKIIINVCGKAGIGKDTFINEFMEVQKAVSTSSIFPVVRFLQDEFGIIVNDDEKTPEYRQLLNTIYSAVNNFKNEKSLIRSYAEDIEMIFLDSFDEFEPLKIVFVQIRDLGDYNVFKEHFDNSYNIYNLYLNNTKMDKDYTDYPSVDTIECDDKSKYDYVVNIADNNSKHIFIKTFINSFMN